MAESGGDLDRVGGGFDVDGLKRKYRRQDTASKPRHALAAIEREILEEIASQSGRYGNRLDALLGELTTLRQSIDRASIQRRPGEAGHTEAWQELNAAIVQYNRLRAQAQQVQHYLIIHREAMGFWHHDDVFRRYPVPAALTPFPPSHPPGSAGHPSR
jgi:hypothetical protein